MKPKDIAAMVIAATIFLAAGYLAYTQLFAPKKTGAKTGTPVEVIGSIPSTVDNDEVTKLQNKSLNQDFTPILDLSSGLGNTAPFGK